MDRQRHLNRSAWVMLFVGFVAYVFSGGRWNVGFTAWIWPFAFLYFSRKTKTKRQFLLLAAAIAAGHVIKWPDLLDAGFWLGAVFCLLWSVCWILPFLADRLFAQKLPGAFLGSLIFPTVFVSLECLRALTPIGSLGLLAYTQAGFLPLMQVTSLTGSIGLSFLLLWFGAVAVTAAEKRPRWKPDAGVCLALLAASVCFGCIRCGAFPVGPENTVRVASVIGPFYEKHKDGTYEELPPEESLRYFLSQARRAAEVGAEIACWNEEAFALDDTDEPLLVDAAVTFAKEHGMILIVGYETADTDGSENGESVNKSILVLPNGSVTEYIKTNLIPLVELPGYVKGGGAVPCVATEAGVIANVICFDDTFIGFIREKTGSADVLFVPSWDWSAVKRAHTDLSAFRAVENGYAVVKPSYNGVSAAIDRQGRVIARSDAAEAGFDTVQFADVPVKGMPTVYAKIGGAVDLVFLLSGFAAAAAGLVVLRRQKRKKETVV